MKIEITHTVSEWGKTPIVKKIEIEGTDINDIYAKFFRKYDNGLKYVNTIHCELPQEYQAGYRTWFSDVKNYINNGGDMW
jgi:hypothetical protein